MASVPNFLTRSIAVSVNSG